MMTEEPQTTARNDPRYAEGMAHLQNARWQEATRCFEALRARYGDDPDVMRGLDQAQFKARLDAGAHIRPKRWAFRLRPIVVGVLLVVAMLVLGVLICPGAGPPGRSSRDHRAARTRRSSSSLPRERPPWRAGSWTRQRPPSEMSRRLTPTTLRQPMGWKWWRPGGN